MKDTGRASFVKPTRYQIAALALVFAGVMESAAPASADSEIHSFSILGNQLNPTGMQPGLATDIRGMSQRIQFSRSPSGLLYPKPLIYPAMSQSEDSPAWWHSGWAETGLIGNLSDTKTASFDEYGDWDTGLVASFGFRAENRDTALYVQGRAGSIGRRDQYYELETGRYGVFNIGLHFNATPHLFSTNAKVLWNGAGTGNLTLPAGMLPGAVTGPEVQAALNAAPATRLSITRNNAGLSANYIASDTWELYFNLANEWRDGSRPIGSAFWFPSRGAAELVQPIKYRTLVVSTGARFRGEAMQANLAYAGSFFRNDIASLTWENPALGAGGFIPERGRITLAPDNDYHMVKGDFAWVLSDVRFAASASYSAMRQNENLLPSVVNSGFTPIDLSNWNTLAALSQSSADASIDTFDGFAQLRYTPVTDLSLTLETRYRNQDNKTDYLSFNPLTSEFGYLGLDGALSRIYNPASPGNDRPIRNIPFATDKFDISAKADYRLSSHTRLNLSYAHKELERRYREVAKSTDNVFKTQIASVGHDWGTVRISYEYADRSGSAYIPDPYVFARSASLPGYVPRAGGDAPLTLDSFRKYDVADRAEHQFSIQTNFIVSERTDLQISGSHKSVNYNADYGLQSLNSFDANGSLTTQILPAMSFTAFYSFQSHQRDIAAINAARSNSGDASAGGPNYPLENAWSESADDVNHVLGGNLHYDLESVTLDLSYTYSMANSEFAYAYAGLGAISGGLTAAEAGSAFPDQIFKHHVLEASVLWPFNEKILIRTYYRLEHENLADFHYDGLTNVVGNHIFLGAVPEDYTAHVLGIFTQFHF
jgi:MtrB/PioB family decaheme-associated outer membrane protein